MLLRNQRANQQDQEKKLLVSKWLKYCDISFKNYIEVFTDELNSLDDRINLFKKAKNIVCELGAGMHNLLYCKEGVNIIVMYQKNNISWLEEYYPLFRYKKMNVKIIAGETTSPKHNGNWLNTPWKLDIHDLESVLFKLKS